MIEIKPALDNAVEKMGFISRYLLFGVIMISFDKSFCQMNLQSTVEMIMRSTGGGNSVKLINSGFTFYAGVVKSTYAFSYSGLNGVDIQDSIGNRVTSNAKGEFVLMTKPVGYLVFSRDSFISDTLRSISTVNYTHPVLGTLAVKKRVANIQKEFHISKDCALFLVKNKLPLFEVNGYMQKQEKLYKIKKAKGRIFNKQTHKPIADLNVRVSTLISQRWYPGLSPLDTSCSYKTQTDLSGSFEIKTPVTDTFEQLVCVYNLPGKCVFQKLSSDSTNPQKSLRFWQLGSDSMPCGPQADLTLNGAPYVVLNIHTFNPKKDTVVVNFYVDTTELRNPRDTISPTNDNPNKDPLPPVTGAVPTVIAPNPGTANDPTLNTSNKEKNTGNTEQTKKDIDSLINKPTSMTGSELADLQKAVATLTTRVDTLSTYAQIILGCATAILGLLVYLVKTQIELGKNVALILQRIEKQDKDFGEVKGDLKDLRKDPIKDIQATLADISKTLNTLKKS